MGEGLEFESEQTFYSAYDVGFKVSAAIWAVCKKPTSAEYIGKLARKYIDEYVKRYPETTEARRYRQGKNDLREMSGDLVLGFARTFCTSGMRYYRISGKEVDEIVNYLSERV